MSPLVLLRSVAIERAGRTLLRGLDWTLRPGRVHWIIGENGLGKSSLLRTLAGRLAPAAGSIEMRGVAGTIRPVWWGAHMRSPHGVTVRAWDALCAALVPAAPADEGLRPAGIRPAQSLERLSTGEAKRLMLDAVLRKPSELVLLDEPFEHLSPPAKRRLRQALTDRAQRDVVVVATNQTEWRLPDEPALKLLGDAHWSRVA